MPYRAGDRVQRRTWDGDSRKGTIVNVTMSRPSSYSKSHPIYSIKWDGQEYIEHGYLDVSLRRIPS